MSAVDNALEVLSMHRTINEQIAEIDRLKVIEESFAEMSIEISRYMALSSFGVDFPNAEITAILTRHAINKWSRL